VDEVLASAEDLEERVILVVEEVEAAKALLARRERESLHGMAG